MRFPSCGSPLSINLVFFALMWRPTITAGASRRSCALESYSLTAAMSSEVYEDSDQFSIAPGNSFDQLAKTEYLLQSASTLPEAVLVRRRIG